MKLRKVLSFLLRYGLAACVGWLANFFMALVGSKSLSSLRVPADGTVQGNFYSGAGIVDE